MQPGQVLSVDRSRSGREDELVAQVQAGQLPVYEVLVRRYIDALRAWAVARSPASIDADDIVQRAFLIALERIGDFQLGRNFGAWLFGIARHELATACRRLEQEQRLRGSLVQAAISRSLGRDLAEDSGTGDDLSALRHCLQQLSAAERELLQRRYASDCRIEAIAAEQACPAGTIKKRLYTLRQRLKRCMDRWFAAQEDAP